MSQTPETGAKAPTGMTIFRLDEARPHQPGPTGGLTEVSKAGLASLAEAGLGDGAQARVLFSAPGFSLMYAWFKSGLPLFRHSHGPDCLYEVIGGSLQMGDQVLRKGDGFFLTAGTPYAFTAGPEGVEILEFRHEPLRDTVIHANNPAYWEKAVEVVRSRREAWRDEQPPV